MNQFYRNLAIWMLIALAMVFLFNTFNAKKVDFEDVSFSAFTKNVEEGKVKEVTIKGQEITGKYVENAGKEKKAFHTYAPDDPDLVKNLRGKNVQITARPLDDNPWYMTMLVSWLPMLLLIGVWIFFMRQMQAGGGKAMSFGKSRAKLVTEVTNKVTFADVAGIEEAKEELQEIIAFLKDPKRFTKLGGRIPKGVLLVGAPGTGKTLLARAIAGEAGVPFFSISGSDFVEMFVGVGAARVRDLFIQGKKSAPCIIFIDEIDAVGRHRGAGLGGGHDEREQTLNQLLVEMDGFESNDGLILISATNRPDVLDPALMRPGTVRPPGGGPQAGREGAGADPRRSHAEDHARPGREARACWPRGRRDSPAPISRTWPTRRRSTRRGSTSPRSRWNASRWPRTR